MAVDDQVPNLKQSIQETERAIRSGGTYTIQDLSSQTGLPIEEVRRAMDQLLTKYRGGLSLLDDGTLVYNMGTSLNRRGEKTRQEKWEDFKAWAWKAFKAFYRVWITITLIVYFVIFLLILVGMIFASSSDSNRRSSKGGASLGGMTHLIGQLFISIFQWRTIYGSTHYRRDTYGYPYRHFNPVEDPFSSRSSNRDENKKGFIASVYDFVFGPERFEPHPLENHKEAAAFLRKEKGIVTLSELKALAGWQNEAAEEFFSDIIVRFKGRSYLSDEGVLYGDFEELLQSEQDQDGQIEWYWDEYEAEYELTGNSKGRNFLISLMNGFNLLMSVLILNGQVLAHPETSQQLAVVFWGLGIVPFLFSSIFFLVPAIRYFQLKDKEKERHLKNIRKRLLKEIWFDEDKVVPLVQLMEAANKSESMEKLNQNQIDQAMEELLLDFHGELEPSDTGEPVYHFEHLKRELETAEHLRQNRGQVNKGKVVMEVGDEEFTE